MNFEDNNIVLESVIEEEQEENMGATNVTETDGDVYQYVQKASVVQKMVRKFTHGGLKQMPLLVRRNTVASCSNVANDVKTGKQQNHVIWDDEVTGEDAATDHEFSSLMERVNDIKLEESATYRKFLSQNDTSSLNRGSAARMSLPSGALKSYMRSTKASVMKTRENSPPCNVEVGKNMLTNKGSPDLQALTSSTKKTILCKGKCRNSIPEGSEGLLKRKGVVVKPNIPPVLLKGINKLQQQASTPVTKQSIEGNLLALSDGNTASAESKRKPEEMATSLPHHLLRGQCHVNCSHCSLVDLWFTIWHVEFHKK